MENKVNSNSKDFDKQYEREIPELAQAIARSGGTTGLTPRLMQFAYEQKTIELQHKLNKENIELQYNLNKLLTDKQAKTTIICTIVTATATVLAAIAGTYLAYTLSKIKVPQELQPTVKQTSQSQTIPKTSVILLEQKTSKAPSQPPK